MTSGASATNSAACLRISAASVVAQRVSIRTLRPMVRPIAPAPDGTPRGGPEIPHRPRLWAAGSSDAPHALLRACSERPRRRAAEERDECAPPHGLPSLRPRAAHYHTASVKTPSCADKSIVEWQRWGQSLQVRAEHLSTHARFPSNTDRKLSPLGFVAMPVRRHFALQQIFFSRSPRRRGRVASVGYCRRASWRSRR